MRLPSPLLTGAMPLLVLLPAVPAQQPLQQCRLATRVYRGLGGAAAAGWLGFVGVKIRYSDWRDDAHAASVRRVRNQLTIGSALAGGVLSTVLLRKYACTPSTDAPRIAAPVGRVHQAITLAEIQDSGLNGNAYDLIYSLRRNWLNERGVDGFSEATRFDGQSGATLTAEPRLIVYLDNARMGTLSALRDIPVAGITSIRYYTPGEANFRWGAGHEHGAIQVLTVTE